MKYMLTNNISAVNTTKNQGLAYVPPKQRRPCLRCG